MNIEEKVLGVGLVFPIQIGDSGKPEYISGIELVKKSLEQILCWTFGTRYFLGEFGTVIPLALEEPDDDTTRSYIEFHLTQKVPQWDKRFTINDIAFKQGDSIGKLDILISVTLNQVNIKEVWVFPLDI